jgi:hypothetical protein
MNRELFARPESIQPIPVILAPSLARMWAEEMEKENES